MKTDRTRSSRALRLRKFPYPYTAALTILSGRYGLQTTDEFCQFHRFLNTTRETPRGKGLGLEISDSFWFYDEIGRFSYFDGYSNVPSQQAPIIRDYLAAGYIDSLNTWGDFSKRRFDRKYAEWAVEESIKHGFELPVWLNYEKANATQHVTGASAHFDLLEQAGCRWLSRSLTSIVGQDRHLTVRDDLLLNQHKSSSRAMHVTKTLAKRAFMGADHLFGGPLGIYDDNYHNHFLRPTTLGTGRVMYEFLGFNNHQTNIWHGLHVPDLLRQLNRATLDQLIAVQGYMVVYNQLEFGDCYHPDIIAALRGLSEKELAGELWVTTIAKMARYNLAYRCLRWDEALDNNRNMVVDIQASCDDPILGKVQVTVRDLEGITFAVPKDVQSLKFKLNDKLLEHVESSKGAEVLAGFPIRRLEFPE